MRFEPPSTPVRPLPRRKEEGAHVAGGGPDRAGPRHPPGAFVSQGAGPPPAATRKRARQRLGGTRRRPPRVLAGQDSTQRGGSRRRWSSREVRRQSSVITCDAPLRSRGPSKGARSGVNRRRSARPPREPPGGILAGDERNSTIDEGSPAPGARCRGRASSPGGEENRMTTGCRVRRAVDTTGRARPLVRCSSSRRCPSRTAPAHGAKWKARDGIEASVETASAAGKASMVAGRERAPTPVAAGPSLQANRRVERARRAGGNAPRGAQVEDALVARAPAPRGKVHDRRAGPAALCWAHSRIGGVRTHPPGRSGTDEGAPPTQRLRRPPGRTSRPSARRYLRTLSSIWSGTLVRINLR